MLFLLQAVPQTSPDLTPGDKSDLPDAPRQNLHKIVYDISDARLPRSYVLELIFKEQLCV